MVKSTTIRMDEDLKRETVEMLDSLGISFNAYVTMASRQLVTQRRVPFSIVAPEREPTEETRRAMVAAEAKALGLLPDDAPVFDSGDDVLDYLEA